MAEPSSSQSEAATSCISRRQGDRRRRPTWSLLYGSFTPRRRAPRRTEDRNSFVADWHHSGLLYVVIAILLLSAADAYLTLQLLAQGARELNWVMAQLVHADPHSFVALKMALTGLGVTLLVTRRHAVLFGRIPIEGILYALLLGYVALVAYELAIF